MMEQVNADLIDGPLAHLPSAVFTANAAWLTCAAIMYNLLCAFGCLASAFHARARGATLRRQLITVPARLAGTAAATSPCTCATLALATRVDDRLRHRPRPAARPAGLTWPESLVTAPQGRRPRQSPRACGAHPRPNPRHPDKPLPGYGKPPMPENMASTCGKQSSWRNGTQE
jgi:hypothetical protein